jgi:hypothetical protein
MGVEFYSDKMGPGMALFSDLRLDMNPHRCDSLYPYLTKWTKEALDLPHQQMIVVGARLGTAPFVISEYSGVNIIGVDSSHELSRIAVDRYEHNGRVRVSQAEYPEVEYMWDSEFDAGIVVDAINHVDSETMVGLLRGVGKSLKRDSQVLVVTINPEVYGECLKGFTNLHIEEETEENFLPQKTEAAFGDLVWVTPGGVRIVFEDCSLYMHTQDNVEAALEHAGLQLVGRPTPFGKSFVNGREVDGYYLAYHLINSKIGTLPLNKIAENISIEFAEKYGKYLEYLIHDVVEDLIRKFNSLEWSEELEELLPVAAKLRESIGDKSLPFIRGFSQEDIEIGMEKAIPVLVRDQGRYISVGLVEGTDDKGYLALALETNLRIFEQTLYAHFRRMGIDHEWDVGMVVEEVFKELMFLDNAGSWYRYEKDFPSNSLYATFITAREDGGLGWGTEDEFVKFRREYIDFVAYGERYKRQEYFA